MWYHQIIRQVLFLRMTDEQVGIGSVNISGSYQIISVHQVESDRVMHQKYL